GSSVVARTAPPASRIAHPRRSADISRIRVIAPSASAAETRPAGSSPLVSRAVATSRSTYRRVAGTGLLARGRGGVRDRGPATRDQGLRRLPDRDRGRGGGGGHQPALAPLWALSRALFALERAHREEAQPGARHRVE